MRPLLLYVYSIYILYVYTFINEFIGSILSFYQCKNNNSCQILHTGLLTLTDACKVQTRQEEGVVLVSGWVLLGLEQAVKVPE